MDTGFGRTRRGLLKGLGVGMAAATAPATAIGKASPAFPTRTDLMLAPGLIHLNTASLGPASRGVLDATVAAWREIESSPVYMSYGATGDKVVMRADAVRAKAAALLGCDADEILITRGTTDGLNTVAQGIRLREGDRILTTDQEHGGGSHCWAYRAARDGAAIDRIALSLDQIDPAAIMRQFEAAITPRTRVVSVSHVITTTGFRMPVAEIAALARRHQILCVVDGAQAAGNIAVDVRALGCHAYATSGHKWLMGPKGTGLLYVSRDADLDIAPIQWSEARRYGVDSMGVGPMTLAIGLGVAIDAVRAWACPPSRRTIWPCGLARMRGCNASPRCVGPAPRPDRWRAR